MELETEVIEIGYIIFLLHFMKFHVFKLTDITK